MKPKKDPQPQDSLQTAREQFEQWRNTRRKRERIPESLWAAAVALSPTHSTFRISKTLRLNYIELKHRIRANSSGSTSTDFVELNVEHMFCAAQCVVELRSPAGFEMKIRTGTTLPSQLSQLIGCFLGASR
jgi:hypothetical protein